MPGRFLCATLLCFSLDAAVTKIDITERADLPTHNYERLTGKVHFAVDPKLAANKIIADIELAPRNAQGLVEFSADLYIMRPKDPVKSNGTALLEISNRGGRGMLSMFNLASGRGDQDAGDPLLLEMGFTLVWVGWEWDIPARDDRLCAGDQGQHRSGALGDRGESESH
jgi:hypothetical protein